MSRNPKDVPSYKILMLLKHLGKGESWELLPSGSYNIDSVSTITQLLGKTDAMMQIWQVFKQVMAIQQSIQQEQRDQQQQ